MDIDVSGYNNAHQMGEGATHSIARFLDHWALLLLLAWNSHAASALTQTLSRRERERSPSLPLGESWREGWRLAQRPKKRTLECVQLRFLG